MKNFPRLAAFSLSVLAVAALTIGISTPAQAASTVTPVSNLPSMVSTGAGYTDAGKAGNSLVAAMAYLYKGALSPEAYAAYKARQAGQIPTAPQVSAEDYQKGQFSNPVTAPSKLAKGINGVSTVFGGYAIGTTLGSIAGQRVFDVMGIDANGSVCSAAKKDGAVQALLEFGTGQDCAAFNATSGQPINTDVTAGDAMTPYCDPRGCWTYTGKSKVMYEESTQYASFCFNFSGAGDYGGQPTVFWGGYASGKTYSAPLLSDAERTGQTGCKGSNAYALIVYASSTASLDAWFNPAKLLCVVPQGAGDCSGVAPGSPGSVGTGTANPDRYISCDVTGTPSFYQSNPGAMFTEADTDWTKAFPVCPGLPAEVIPTKIDMVLHVVGGGDTLLSSQVTPEPLVQDLAKYRECFGTSLCALELEKNGQSCFAGNQTQCTDWAKDPDQDQYTCKYGTPANPQTVALSECKGVYAPTFQPERVTTGQTYGDPLTGTPTPSNQAPKPDNVTGMNPAVGDDRISCLPNGFTLNPIDWVVAPLKCVFAPRPSVVKATTAKIATSTAASPVGQLQTAVAGWSFAAPSGCGGLRIHVAFPSTPLDIRVGQACPGDPLAPVAAVVIWGVGATLAIMGFISIRNSIAGIAEYRGGA